MQLHFIDSSSLYFSFNLLLSELLGVCVPLDVIILPLPTLAVTTAHKILRRHLENASPRFCSNNTKFTAILRFPSAGTRCNPETRRSSLHFRPLDERCVADPFLPAFNQYKPSSSSRNSKQENNLAAQWVPFGYRRNSRGGFPGEHICGRTRCWWQLGDGDAKATRGGGRTRVLQPETADAVCHRSMKPKLSAFFGNSSLLTIKRHDTKCGYTFGAGCHRARCLQRKTVEGIDHAAPFLM